MAPSRLVFGVELEMALKPIYGAAERAGKGKMQIEREHYQWFAGYLTNQYNLPALGNATSHKYPPGYTKWWITFDRSIATSNDHSMEPSLSR